MAACLRVFANKVTAQGVPQDCLVSCRVLTFVHTQTKAFFMDTRVQFRIDEETKRLAQQMTESQGRTLSDACRDLAEQLAEQQRKALSHDTWLTEQVNLAFEKFDAGKSTFIENEQAKSRMAKRKAKIRGRG